MSPEVIAQLDAIKVNMNEAGMNTINIVLAFVMFGVALGIKPRTFVDIIKKPKSIILGIICQMILLPALTFLLTITFKNWISPMIALGMILVASCPGGNISNFITSLSKGNTELSVSLTAVNTAACIFTTPLNFSFWGKMYNISVATQVVPIRHKTRFLAHQFIIISAKHRVCRRRHIKALILSAQRTVATKILILVFHFTFMTLI